jgi:hypothetical protein
MPTDLAKKWTGGDCGLRQSIGNADNNIAVLSATQ